MRLVLDPAWEVCYIEVTKSERRVLEWPPRRTAAQQQADVRLFLQRHNGPVDFWADIVGDPKPLEYDTLARRAAEIARIAYPFFTQYERNRRAPWPPETAFLYGIEAREVPDAAVSA